MQRWGLPYRLMPIMEHPFGGSWGYQALSQSPPVRALAPARLRESSKLPSGDIGVILDWVPAHSPPNQGLAQLTATRVRVRHREGFHQEGTDDLHWAARSSPVHAGVGVAMDQTLHIDAARGCGGVDATAIFAQAPEWVTNRHGGRENLEAMTSCDNERRGGPEARERW